MKIILTDGLIIRICSDIVPNGALVVSQFDKATISYSMLVDCGDKNSLSILFSKLLENYLLREKTPALQELIDSELLQGLHIAIFEFCTLLGLGKVIRESSTTEATIKQEKEPRSVRIERQSISDVALLFDGRTIRDWFSTIVALLRQIATENGVEYMEPNDDQLIGPKKLEL